MSMLVLLFINGDSDNVQVFLVTIIIDELHDTCIVSIYKGEIHSVIINDFIKKYIILTTNCLLLQYLMCVETLVNADAS